MKEYTKPLMNIVSEAEGVYAASGAKKCDSKYMLGVWQGQDNTPWGAEERGYKQQFGCLGCPAHTANGCGLESHYVQSGFAESYDADAGKRMPSWERKGYGPDDVVTDWNM